MACETSKQAWDKLKEDLDKIMVVVNNIRLLGDQISDFRIVEKTKEEQANKRNTLKEHFKLEARGLELLKK
ncbi:hypothetical protein PVK06_007501 [Gossypium arboreum]|uniref:Uncharacterized protein n=1 Tax=Gossypium arboreum TaxID=29729 RepID=A0ABR0QHH0_GOSAR|nr:hypothetical protein PVK06_007501 [Gossypium arboreum]